jgi:hypothetical protein
MMDDGIPTASIDEMQAEMETSCARQLAMLHEWLRQEGAPREAFARVDALFNATLARSRAQIDAWRAQLDGAPMSLQ